MFKRCFERFSETWKDCLREKKDGRTLILTTHFMDEALSQILLTRIAMSLRKLIFN